MPRARDDRYDEVVRALADPRFYPHRPKTVEHVQTHISHVFLAGPYVYKLKKPVRFPFLDFGTTERRRHFCAEEVRLNRRLCPAVYLDVVAITRGARGRLALGGPGAAVEHVVWMRRLPAERMLGALLASGGLSGDAIDRVAHTIAAFHAGAPTGPAVAAHAAPEVLRERWEDETRSTAAFAGSVLPAEDHAMLADFGPTFIRRHETLFRARQDGGRIREGHGDLHADNVCLLDRPMPGRDGLPPVPAGVHAFDCIEFSHAFRCNDVASEIAFLAMDLERLGHRELADRLVAGYAAAADDPLIPVLVPFYACSRAGVRGRVEGIESSEPEVDAAARAPAAERARRHFALAVRLAWRVGGPVVIACAGLAGTGKSTLASELAATTGFELLASDVIRRGHGERRPAVPDDPDRYSAAAREAVYATLCAAADVALGAGRSVIADATFIRAADRRRLARVAASRHAPCVFVECRAPETIVRERLAARTAGTSLSDARWDTHVAQREQRDPFGTEEHHIAVDTGHGLAASRAVTIRRLWPWRQGRPLPP